jgi:cytochrome c2
MKLGLSLVALAAIASAASTFSAHAQNVGEPGNVRAGRELAITTCSECHVVVERRWTPRPVGGPPDFTHITATPGMNGTALFVFLHTPHPTMPNLILSNRQPNDAIAYILSLRKQSRP